MDKEDKRMIDVTIQEFIDNIVERLGEKFQVEPPRFIPEEEAKKLLNCGKTQLYHLRINGKISYVQDEEHRKMILYDRISIFEYQKKNLKKAF